MAENIIKNSTILNNLIYNNINVQHIEATNRIFSNIQPHMFEMARQIAKIQKTVNPVILQAVQQFNNYNNMARQFLIVNSHAINQARQMTQQIAMALNPVMLEYANQWNRIEKMKIAEIFAALQEPCTVDFEGILDDGLDGSIDNLSGPNRIEITEAAKLIALQPKGWEISLFERYTEWKEKHPILARILLYVILPLFISVAATFISVTTQKIALRNNPSSNATIIAIIIENQNVVILNSEVPYWYEIEYENAETGKIQNGWVPKRFIE